MRYWLQYHSYDNLGFLPGGYETDETNLSRINTKDFEISCISTKKKAICNAGGDRVLLIVGYGKSPKNYILWSWVEFGAEVDVEIHDGEFDAFGEDGRVLNPPALLTGTEFDAFKKQLANFSLGFINISDRPYTKTLIDLASL